MVSGNITGTIVAPLAGFFKKLFIFCYEWKDNYTILLSCGIIASSHLLLIETRSFSLGGDHPAPTLYFILATYSHIACRVVH